MIIGDGYRVASVLRRVFSEYALGVDVWSRDGGNVVWLNCSLVGVRVRVMSEESGFWITVYDDNDGGRAEEVACTVEEGAEVLRAVIEDALCAWGPLARKYELRKMRREYV